MDRGADFSGSGLDELMAGFPGYDCRPPIPRSRADFNRAKFAGGRQDAAEGFVFSGTFRKLDGAAAPAFSTCSRFYLLSIYATANLEFDSFQRGTT
jgi:hypothetical protein